MFKSCVITCLRQEIEMKLYMNKKKYIELNNLAQENYGNISIIKMFCKKFHDIDDFYKITPIIERTNKIADKLYAEFINMFEV